MYGGHFLSTSCHCCKFQVGITIDPISPATRIAPNIKYALNREFFCNSMLS